MGDYRIPIPARRRVTVTIGELNDRVVTLRPISGRVMKAWEEVRKHPDEPSRILDVVELLIGGDGGLTTDEILDLSSDALEAIMAASAVPIAELEAAAKKDAATGTA